ncbi:hypothetical protein M0802_006524 [Mischocyttarus mexicanus]|nr:hypothetical protein M0802_006524 [Mischocyttarus mexicanus]
MKRMGERGRIRFLVLLLLLKISLGRVKAFFVTLRYHDDDEEEEEGRRKFLNVRKSGGAGSSKGVVTKKVEGSAEAVSLDYRGQSS